MIAGSARRTNQHNCNEKVESINVLRFVYSSTLLSQLVKAKATPIRLLKMC